VLKLIAVFLPRDAGIQGMLRLGAGSQRARLRSDTKLILAQPTYQLQAQ